MKLFFVPLGRALAAIVAPLILLVLALRPFFASTPWEWLELVALMVAPAALILAARAARGREIGAFPAALWGWTFFVFAGIGLAANGIGGLVLYPAMFAAAVFFVRWLIRKRSKQEHSWVALGLANVLAVLVLSSVFLLRLPSPPEHQVVMVGFDGIGWEVVDELIEEGRLPSFNRLQQEGFRAELETLTPILSPSIWTSIATGVRPERHGVTDFWASSRQVRAKRVWDIADEQGLESGVYGYLVTWPPSDKKSGFLVPGWLAQGPETLPAELSFVKQLELDEKGKTSTSGFRLLSAGCRSLRHGATLATLNAAAGYLWKTRIRSADSYERALESRLLKHRLDRDIFYELLRTRQPHLAIFYNSATDAIQHNFFRFYRPNAFKDGFGETDRQSFIEAIPRAFDEADESLRRITSLVDSSSHLMVVSDHGQRPKEDRGSMWYSIAAGELIEKLGLDDRLSVTTIANAAFLRSKGDERMGEEALDLLASVVTDDQQPLFKLANHEPGQALLHARQDYEPSLHKTLVLGDVSLSAGDFLRYSTEVSGDHTKRALLLMRGPRVKQARTDLAGSVLDVAPTVLALLDLPVARDLDGRVLEEALIQPASELRYVDSFGEREFDEEEVILNEETKRQLRALGYVE